VTSAFRKLDFVESYGVGRVARRLMLCPALCHHRDTQSLRLRSCVMLMQAHLRFHQDSLAAGSAAAIPNAVLLFFFPSQITEIFQA